jgi:hypothetical protein
MHTRPGTLPGRRTAAPDDEEEEEGVCGAASPAPAFARPPLPRPRYAIMARSTIGDQKAKA